MYMANYRYLVLNVWKMSRWILMSPLVTYDVLL